MPLQIHAGMRHTNNVHNIIIDTVKNKAMFALIVGTHKRPKLRVKIRWRQSGFGSIGASSIRVRDTEEACSISRIQSDKMLRWCGVSFVSYEVKA